MTDLPAYEKLGAFYLGREVGADGAVSRQPLLYDSRDLVTHGVCIGMTGSGKTGLCLGLIEEAAIDGIPVLAIDPKGDLGNLLLTFPALAPADFAPWVEPDAARRAGLEPDAFAAREAERWRAGLAEWDQDGARIARLRAAADLAIYTPGSTAGIPLSVLGSFAASPPAQREDTELLAERAGATAAALLALLGVESDPLAGREHILLSLVLVRAWGDGRSPDLAGLIEALQRPGIERVGVVDLETFFPAKERFELAMRLNRLLASPGFAAWGQGQPIDLDTLLRTSDGRPRVAVVSIAHLAERERMFVVTLLLQQLLAWTRAQSGTGSLRALLFIDEIAGYLPPVAMPPSKGPLLTLLKQGRAFGVGCLLATQNPVDLDYKALANAGTWFVGRLQTEQDRERVLDALSATAGAPDRADLARTLGSLAPRRFLLHDVHEDAPVVLATRWTLSYLRGPLTRDEIRRLRAAAAPAAVAPTAGSPAAAAAASASVAPPTLPPDVPQRWLPLRSVPPAGAVLRYRPRLAAFARVLYRADGVEHERALAWLADPARPQPWLEAEPLALAEAELERTPSPEARAWQPMPMIGPWRAQADAVGDAVFRRDRLELLEAPRPGLRSRPGETEPAFRARLSHAAHERRDASVEALRKRYATRIEAARERARRAETAVARENEQAGQARMQGWLAVGGGILGALLGRKTLSSANVGRATTAARGAGRAWQQGQDVARAETELAHWRQEVAELEREAADEVAKLEPADASAEPLERRALAPKRADIVVGTVVLAWEPVWVDATGAAAPAWR